MDRVCSNCVCWHYSRHTEEKYGMGVGICTADGSMQWCEHKCPFAILKDEVDGDDKL